jgi:hypothetical protein
MQDQKNTAEERQALLQPPLNSSMESLPSSPNLSMESLPLSVSNQEKAVDIPYQPKQGENSQTYRPITPQTTGRFAKNVLPAMKPTVNSSNQRI